MVRLCFWFPKAAISLMSSALKPLYSKAKSWQREGRLASSIAHQINNPLESVMNLIYLARHARPADAERYLEIADQEIRRVSIIANQTLRFHKQASKPQAATSADLF